jgi:hypothetical protein
MILLLATCVFGEDFVLRNENILIDKSVAKINEISGELKAKTGAGVYVEAIEKLNANETIGAYAKRIAGELNAPYALLVVSSADRQIDAVISPDLEDQIDKGDILCITPGCPVIPLIAEHRRDISINQQISAGIFNGVAYITDTIAEKRGVTLESSVGSGSQNFSVALTWVVKIMVLLTLAGLVVAWRRSKTEGKY